MLTLAACNSARSESLATATFVALRATAAATTELIPSPSVASTPARVILPTPFITAPASNELAILPILMYHHLRDLPGNASELDLTWTVAPENFRAQMGWLAERGYQTVTMAQIAAHLRERKPLPAKPIVISFDDGWEDGYSVAFPVLRQHNFSGAFYVYTNPLGKSQYLTREQMREMAAAGMEFQAHTLTHAHIRNLPPDAARKEIVESKAFLEKELGKPVTSFAYPFGEYNAALIEMVKRAGFASAVTIAAGYRQRADELYTLHRVRVTYRDSLEDFVNRLPP